jgi:glycosyltransferase involved in cell wall biosynthesis
LKIISDTWKLFLERELSGIFVVSRAALDGLRQKYRITCPVSVVGQSFDEEIFYPDKNSELPDRVRSKLNCLFVGRLVEEKGIDDILVLAGRLPNQKFDFQFVGDGPLKSHILEKSKQLDNVKWLGFIASPFKLAEIYRNCDVLLLPGRISSRWEETFGMVIIEAMACGVVVLASDLSGPRQILQDNRTGFLVKETEFIEAALRILDELHNNSIELQERKRKSILLAQQYTARRLSEKWEDLLRDYLQ